MARELVLASTIEDPEDFQSAYGYCDKTDCCLGNRLGEVTWSEDYEKWLCPDHIQVVREENRRIARRETEDYAYMYGEDDTDPAGYDADWERTRAAMEDGGMFDGQNDPAPTLEDEIAEAAEAYRQACLGYAQAHQEDMAKYLTAYGTMQEAQQKMFALLEKRNG